ncbi:MAG: hypothetical protein NC541_10455 [bacterium]|nr:hypothetical protein [bacterium]
MDIQLYDNYEDDGQLSMFDLGEDIEKLQTPVEETEDREKELPASGSAGIRIQKCTCCGKMLFVREEQGLYSSACNACGVRYVQRI